jgi:hypothetical protein
MHSSDQLKAKGSVLRRRAKWLVMIVVLVGVWAAVVELGLRSANAQLVAAPILTVLVFGALEFVDWVRARVDDHWTTPGSDKLTEIDDLHDVNLAGVIVGVLMLILGLILSATVTPVGGGVIAVASLVYVMYLMYGGIFR